MLRKLGCRPVTAGNIILNPKFLKKQQINLQYGARKQNELKTFFGSIRFRSSSESPDSLKRFMISVTVLEPIE
jgi:hypothetical protein